MHCNHHRYYAPYLTVGYAEADPLGLEAGWNRFGYVGGDPTGAVDPQGLQASIPWGNITGGAVAGGSRGITGGLVGVGIGAGMGAFISACQPTDRERCERDCDRKYDMGRDFVAQ